MCVRGHFRASKFPISGTKLLEENKLYFSLNKERLNVREWFYSSLCSRHSEMSSIFASLSAHFNSSWMQRFKGG